MNANREYLMDWIHSLDNGKRLEGFITEAYFERELAPAKLGLNTPVFGWMTASLPSVCNRRYWFKVAAPDYEPGAVEQELIRSYSRTPGRPDRKDRFFFLHPECTRAAPGGQQPPVTFRVTQWDCHKENQTVAARRGNGAHTEARKHLLESVRKMDARLAQHYREQKKVRSREAVSIHDWLDRHFTDCELFRLLAQRCAMNLVGKYSVDRDAIDLQDDQLRFVEFKRKYPTNGWWHHARRPCFPIHRYEAKKLGRLCDPEFTRAADAATRNAVVKKWEDCIRTYLSQSSQWTPSNEPAFGLDLSHVHTVEEAQDRGATFTHVIWENNETKLEELFNINMTPKKKPSLLSFDLARDSFTGITMTPGRDSSAFHGRPRMQLVFPVG